jgi:RNA polymerase sigma-70 factor (ECF subfamily)
MDVTLAQMTATLSASPAAPMLDARIDAETTRLAQQAQAGDADAFCALIELHERAARRVAVAALGDAADADEAVQDACLAAWQRIEHLDEPAAFRSWLLRITWRKALDRRRSLRSWLKRFVTAPAFEAGLTGSRRDTGNDVLATAADRERSIVDKLLLDERDRTIARVIRSLPSKLRDPFLLAASGEHRYDDIAVMLMLPVGTVKWRVSEARRVLREKLTRLGIDR